MTESMFICTAELEDRLRRRLPRYVRIGDREHVAVDAANVAEVIAEFFKTLRGYGIEGGQESDRSEFYKESHDPQWLARLALIEAGVSVDLFADPFGRGVYIRGRRWP